MSVTVNRGGGGTLDYNSLNNKPEPITVDATNGLEISVGNELSISLASDISNGALSSTDWETFNNKQDSISFPLPPSMGGFNVYEIEIDFGTNPVYDKTFIITNVLSSPSSKIIAYPSGNVATGRIGNDLEWDSISYGAMASTGDFTLTATCSTGAVVGKRKVYYSIL